MAEGVLLVRLLPRQAKATRVMTDEAASDRLFKASPTMATEPVMVPASSFPRHSRALRPMPTAPARIPHSCRVSGADTSRPASQRLITSLIKFHSSLPAQNTRGV